MNKLITTVLVLAAFAGWAQPAVPLQALQDSAEARNINLQQLALEVERARQSNLPYSGIGNSQLQYSFGEVDGPAQDYQVQFQQNLGNPLSGMKQFAVRKAAVQSRQLELQLQKAWLSKELYSAYAGWYSYWQMLQTWQAVKSSFAEALAVAERQQAAGEISRVEVGLARGRFQEALQNENQVRQQMLQQRTVLEILTRTDLSEKIPEELALPLANETAGKLYESFYQSQVTLAQQNNQRQISNFFPSILVGYTQQQLNLVPGYQVFTVGLTIPLLDATTYQQRQLAQISLQQKELEQKQQDYNRQRNLSMLREQKVEIMQSLRQMKATPEETSENLRIARQRYELGEIDLLELSQSLQALSAADLNHQKLLMSLHQVQAQINYLNAQKQ